MSWWDVAASQAGMVSHDQLIRTGVSEDAVHRSARAGELTRYCRGIYRASAAPVTWQARLWAAVLATDGVLSHASAARLWGVYDGDDSCVHVTLPHSRRVAIPPRTVVHRVPLPGYARYVRDDLPVTTQAWTVLDLIASLPSGQAMTLADRAVQRGWLTADQVERRLREQPGRTGNRQLRIIGSQLGDGAASHSERVLHGILRRAGITGWQANYPVWVDGELAAVVDVALPARRLAIEIDGMAFHTDPERFQRDRVRQNQLTALGWTVIRFTWWDLTERPGYVVATLRQFGSVSRAARG